MNMLDTSSMPERPTKNPEPKPQVFRSDKALGNALRVAVIAHLPVLLNEINEMVDGEVASLMLDFWAAPVFVGTVAFGLSVVVDMAIHGTKWGQSIRESVKRVMQS